MNSTSLVALICDHHLDPRLKKRAAWLKNAFGNCDLYVDPTRGQHFQEKSGKNNYAAISKARIRKLKGYDLIYISGARIILSFFIKFLVLRYIYKVELIYEIPDLPLRSKSKVRNKLNSLLFYLIVKVLFKRIVITSKAFLMKLPGNLDYFECENLPSADMLLNIKEEQKLAQHQKITISFVGVIRYLHQMEFLIKFASLHEYVKVRFHGGPMDNISKLKTFHEKFGAKADVEFFGPFDTNELQRIYSNTTYIYSVYDSKQENVRLALPNKLYESNIYKVPLIVSTETFLYERVLEGNNGFGVDSQCFEKFEKDMLYGLNKEYSFDYERFKNQILGQEKLFLGWVKSSSEIKDITVF